MRPTAATRQDLELDAGKGECVPAIFQAPGGTSRAPGVLLLHGFTSHKERMADSVGAALLRRGVASLALDFPLHGTREGRLDDLSARSPLALVKTWRLAEHEAETGLHFLGQHAAVDGTRLAVAGYSLGAFMGTRIAARASTVRALALVAGGDLPLRMPFETMIRAAADPRRAVRLLAGRPLLMINGRRDRTIRPTQANALFAAAAEPKELRWYDGGHWPPQSVIDDVAEWLALRLEARSRSE